MNLLHDENDKQLVSKLRSDDVKAFDALFHKYSGKLFRFSFSLLKNDEDSKEVVQETFLRIWNKRHDMDSSKSFKSFLFTISYNVIIDQLRVRLKTQEYKNFLFHHFESGNSSVIKEEVDYEIINKQIEKAVEELPKKRKLIYKLSRENELSHKEISEKLGISVKTVENQINLSLKHLRKKLGKEVLPVLLFLTLFA